VGVKAEIVLVSFRFIADLLVSIDIISRRGAADGVSGTGEESVAGCRVGHFGGMMGRWVAFPC
jgi:hypothetical protein